RIDVAAQAIDVLESHRLSLLWRRRPLRRGTIVRVEVERALPALGALRTPHERADGVAHTEFPEAPIERLGDHAPRAFGDRVICWSGGGQVRNRVDRLSTR